MEQKDINEAEKLAELLNGNFKGKQNAIKSAELLKFLKTQGLHFSGQTFRKLLGYIRHHDLMKPSFVISNVNIGYWCTDDINEMKDFIDQELHRMSNQYSNIERLRTRIINNKPGKPSTQLHFFI